MDKIKFVTAPSNMITVTMHEDDEIMEGSVDIRLNGVDVLYFNPNSGTMGRVRVYDDKKEALESQGIQFDNDNRIKIKEG